MNNHFIINYVLAQQLKSPSISKTPTDVLSHLLFCNGNGCEVEDGNFVTYFDYGMHVPYSEMYKHINTSTSIIERSNDRDYDHEVDKLYKIKEAFANAKRLASIMDEAFDEDAEDALWGECAAEFNGRYDKVDLVDNYSLADLQSKSTFIAQILASEYSPYLGLSSKFYKAYFFNDKTDKALVRVTIALSEAYISILSDFLLGDYPTTWKKPCGSMSDEDYKKLYTKDIAQLNPLVRRLSDLVK